MNILKFLSDCLVQSTNYYEDFLFSMNELNHIVIYI